MAKKPPQLPLGCVLALFALGALAFVLPVIFVVSVFAFPLFLAFLLFFARWAGPPDQEGIDEGKISAAMLDLQTNQSDLRNQIAEIKARGSKQGVRYLHSEDRFEMRSRDGQELNASLFSARSSLAEVLAKLDLAGRPDTRAFHALWLATKAWRKGRSFRLAFIAASAGFAGSAALLEAIVYQGARPDFLLWGLIPRHTAPHVEIGTTAGWLLGLATLFVARRRDRMLEECESTDLGRHAERLTDPNEPSPDLDAVVDGDPYSALNISPNASDAEVKSAYRLAISRCHPDTVANRSLGIQAAAEEEARLINAAYDEIRTQRGFS